MAVGLDSGYVSAKERGEKAHHPLWVGVDGPRREDLQVGTQLLCPNLCHSGRVPLVAPVAYNEDLGGQLASLGACQCA
jgi:hypothetical protein